MWDIANPVLSFLNFHLKLEKPEQINHRVREERTQ